MDLLIDILTEILLRLPVQSVLRCRCVCKYWCSTIDSSAFKISHLQYSHMNSDTDDDDDEDVLFLLFTRIRFYSNLSMSRVNGKSYQLNFPAFQEFLNFNSYLNYPAFQEVLNFNWVGQLSVIGPVNGLICIYNTNLINPLIAICNPCLGEIKILPVSPISSMSVTHCNIGFGFDYITKGYKVVKLAFSRGRLIYVELYSRATNTWRKLDVFIDESFIWWRTTPIINSPYKVSGRWVHWLTHKYINEKQVDGILSFDMQNEVFKTTSLNVTGRSWRTITTKVYAMDDESFVAFIHDFSSGVQDVWEGKEGRWRHVTVIDLRWLGIVQWPHALWRRRDGIVLYEYDCAWMRVNLYLYDYLIKEIRPLVMPNVFDGTMVLEYKCSLISP